jgi:hypothetical protein
MFFLLKNKQKIRIYEFFFRFWDLSCGNLRYLLPVVIWAAELETTFPKLREQSKKLCCGYVFFFFSVSSCRMSKLLRKHIHYFSFPCCTKFPAELIH